MTIGTSNVSFSSIASEIGKSQTNLSLRDAAQDTLILNPSNSRQTFTLTDSLTLNQQDTAVADNMNLAGSTNFEVSEFKSYDKVSEIIFSSSPNDGSITSKNETLSVNNGTTAITGFCQVPVNMAGEIYGKRVGNDLVWYVSEGDYTSTGSHFMESTGIGTDTECARLAGVGSSTNVSVSYSILRQTTGFFDVFLSAFSSGSTNSSLASTNTKIGYDFRLSGLGECIQSEHSIITCIQMDYTVTVPNYDARKFRFFVGFKGRYQTTAPQCC
tara:strand:- start:717 stop:1529 length:813 start_codon:yes stop_codon:yes gene_type:complete